MTKISNSKRGRIVSTFAILIILAYQIYLYRSNEVIFLMQEDFKHTSGIIISHTKFDNIVVSYSVPFKDTIISKSISPKYDPFVAIKKGDEVGITYNSTNYKEFYIDGYEDGSSIVLVCSLFILSFVGQLVFLFVATNRINESVLFLPTSLSEV
jgi:hypothetical protein